MERTEDVRRISGVEVHFPYKPYPSQISMMAKILVGLKNGQNCLLESPTGSGKSLALLCSALAWQGAQHELARKEDQERSDIENGVCACNHMNKVSPVGGTSSHPNTLPIVSPHFQSTPGNNPSAPGTATSEKSFSSPNPRSLLNTNKQAPTASQTLARLAAQSKGIDDDNDFKDSKTKFRSPGANKVVSRMPIQIAYENTAKPVTVKLLSKGPNGELKAQKQVLMLPVNGPGQAVPAQTVPAQIVLSQTVPGQTAPGQILIHQAVPGQNAPGQVILHQTVPGQIFANQAVPGQIINGTTIPGLELAGQTVPGQIKLINGINVAVTTTGQAVPSNGHTTPSWTDVRGRSNTSDDSSLCCCDCSNKGPPPPKRKVPKIYFGTRTHKQIAQIIRELRKTFYSDVKMTILASREHTCIHPGVSTSSSKNDGCRDLLDGPGCLFNSNVRKLGSQSALKNFYGRDTAWDIEDLVSLCREKHIKACPYYVSRGLRGDSDIIFCPYNYLVDPIIRKTMEINLKDEIIILDEAHNIEDSAREAVSKSVEHDSIIKIIKELEELVKKDIKPFEHQELLDMCIQLDGLIQRNGSQLEQKSFEQASTVWAGMDIVARLVQAGLGPKEFPQLQRVLAAVCEEDESEKRRDGGIPSPRLSVASANVLEALFTMLDFLYREDLRFVEDYRVAIVRSMSYSQTVDTSGHWLSSRKRGRREMRQVFTLNFWCLNPAVAFSDFNIVRNIVLTSGTLSPMSSFSSELGMAFPIQLEANHVIKDSQVWVGSIGEGPTGGKLQATFKNTETFGFQDELGRLVLEVCKAVPHGVLCFLPSYKMLDKLSERWQTTGLWGQIIRKKKIIAEPRRGDKADFDDLLRYFYDVIGGNDCEDSDYDCDETDGMGTEVDGALFLAVCRGKVSEGLDFADNNARAVITVGIPFPNVKDIQVELKRKYNDRYTNERGLLTGSEWYEIQAYRALNQALGRCIRHRNDWGALIMIDDRFVRQPQKYVKGLSKWVRNKAQTFGTYRRAINSLRNFTQLQLKSSDGDSSNISEMPISQGQSSCLETPVKVNSISKIEEFPKGDNLSELTPLKAVTSTPYADGLPANLPTSTPIGRCSPPMSLPNQNDSTVSSMSRHNTSASETTVCKSEVEDVKPEPMSNQTCQQTNDTGINKFFKFCNISSEKNNNKLKPVLKEEKGDDKHDADKVLTVEKEETMNEEEFLMSTPNLFESDMSDPEGETVTENEKAQSLQEKAPVAKRPLFRRAPTKGSKSWNSINEEDAEILVKEDGDGSKKKTARRQIRKQSSGSEYDAPNIHETGINGHCNTEEELDASLNIKRNVRNRKRKVMQGAQDSNKRSKGVDFLDDFGDDGDKIVNKDDKNSKGDITCAKCGAVIVRHAQGTEKRKRLPAFLRSVWNKRSCQNVFVNEGKITPDLKPVTSAIAGADGAELNSHWDADCQCCIQFLKCNSCTQHDKTPIVGARITVAAQNSEFKTGQIFLQAAQVT